jgi:hypothetical protein
MPSSDQEAILRRAIIRAIPEYFVWSEMEQERYRLRVPEEQDFLIRQAVRSFRFRDPWRFCPVRS